MYFFETPGRVKEFITDIYHLKLTISDHTEATSVAGYFDLLFTRDENNVTTMPSKIPSAPAFTMPLSV